MDTLIAKAWRLYAETDDQCVVRPALPILYFGDSEHYFQSACRVITVGLNPSRAEFPDGDGLRRFPLARGLDSPVLDSQHRAVYRAALDAYFRTAPYASWFNAYEPLLQGLGCSYYPGAANSALHTDVCSPLATNPTWSKLPPAVKDRLEPDGERLWRALVEYLAPDLVLASVGREHLPKLVPVLDGSWEIIYTLPRRKPYHVYLLAQSLANGRQMHIAFGTAAQTPFGTVSARDKVVIGDAIRRRLWPDTHEA